MEEIGVQLNWDVIKVIQKEYKIESSFFNY